MFAIYLQIFQEWKLGNAGCKIITYTQIVTLSSTTYILMGMSWDRYKAICTPLDFNPSTTKARRIVAAAWIAALILAIPNLFIYVQVNRCLFHCVIMSFVCSKVGRRTNDDREGNERGLVPRSVIKECQGKRLFRLGNNEGVE